MRKVDFLMLKKHGNYTGIYHYTGYKQVGRNDLTYDAFTWYFHTYNIKVYLKFIKTCY